MGAQVEKPEQLDLSEHAPPLDEYQLKHCGPNYYVWEHCMQQDSLIQFPVNIPNHVILKQQVEMYLLRHRHHLLVSSLFFRRNQNTGKGSVFYERVFTNLSRIKDIPFEDSLQFYYVALKGFQLLFKRFGYFQIEQNMFHITKNNKVKVWCHKDISKSKPKQTQAGVEKGTQEDMVKKIIRIIQQNSDASGSHYPLGPTIYQQASSGFSMAIQKLRNICRQYRFAIPERLTCLDIISKGDVGVLLDEYGQIKQNPNFLEANETIGIQPLNFKQNQQRYSKTQSIFKQQPLMASFEPKIGNQTMINTVPPNQNSMSKIRKPKGLKISHSLQKPNNRDSKGYTINLNNHLPIESPIKNLTAQLPTPKFYQVPQTVLAPHINPLTLYGPNYSSQMRIVGPPLRQTFSQPIPQKFQYQPFTNVFSHPTVQQERRSPIINRPHSMIRANSVDNLNLSNDTPMKKSRQYQVVINYAQKPQAARPPSMPNYPPPGPSQPTNTVSKTQINNFLNVFPPTPQRVNQVQNFKTSPNFYKKDQKTYEFKTIPPSSFVPLQQSNNLLKNNHRISFQSANTFNQNKENKQFQPRSTIINHLLDFKSSQKAQKPNATPFTDQTNFKARFEEFKKNFDYKNYQGKNNTDFLKPNGIKPFEQGIQQQKLGEINKRTNKPFFTGILQNDTVSSYLGTNQFGTIDKRPELKLERMESHKSRFDGTNEFPSVTDVSDNVSYFPNKQKSGQIGGNIWREESLVIKHDPNESKIKLPQAKKYEPKIDDQIWADMMKMRTKIKQNQ